MSRIIHYKIVATSPNNPEHPGVYKGQFEQVANEHPILTALNAEFGDLTVSAVNGLRDWSGHEVDYWAKDLAEDQMAEWTEYEVLNDSSTFHVHLSDNTFCTNQRITSIHQIDWHTKNTALSHFGNDLMQGEEDQLSLSEIIEINSLLDKVKSCTARIGTIFEQARSRWKNRRS